MTPKPIYKTFVCRDYQDEVVAVLMTKTREEATAFMQGKDIHFTRMIEVEQDQLCMPVHVLYCKKE